jgi:hypothetical protein
MYIHQANHETPEIDSRIVPATWVQLALLISYLLGLALNSGSTRKNFRLKRGLLIDPAPTRASFKKRISDRAKLVSGARISASVFNQLVFGTI